MEAIIQEVLADNPLRAMQLMLQIISPENSKELKNVLAHIDPWEAKILVLERAGT